MNERANEGDGVLVRIRDTITRTISPTTATTTAAATLVMYLLRCAATNGIYRELRSGSNCYNLVANTITRKRLAAKQRRSVLLQIIRPQPSARARAPGKEASRGAAPRRSQCRCIRWCFLHETISMRLPYFSNGVWYGCLLALVRARITSPA